MDEFTILNAIDHLEFLMNLGREHYEAGMQQTAKDYFKSAQFISALLLEVETGVDVKEFAAQILSDAVSILATTEFD